MEIGEKYEDLLLEIFNSKLERLELALVESSMKNSRPELLLDLNFLIEIDLVEFDKREQAYYLTHEGYEEVEALKSAANIGAEMMEVEFHSKPSRMNTENLRIFIGGAILILSVISLFIGIKPHVPLKLDNQILEQIKEDVEFKVDSINKSKAMIKKPDDSLAK